MTLKLGSRRPSGRFMNPFDWDATRSIKFRPQAPYWGGDLQTLGRFNEQIDLSRWPARLWQHRFADGDMLLGSLHRSDYWPQGRGRALVVILHPLAGSQNSLRVRQAAATFLSQGYSVLRLDLRGAGSTRKLCRGDYHAGATADLHEVMDLLLSQDFDCLAWCGFSLGGALAVKLAAERGADRALLAVIAVSAPLDLARASRRINALRNRVYQRWLLSRIKRQWLAAPGRDPQLRRAVRRARSLWRFDALATAPAAGCRDAAHYYAEASAAPHLGKIARPCLLVQACDDPLVPLSVFRDASEPNANWVRIALVAGGGHLGFIEQKQPLPTDLRLGRAFLDAAWAQR